MGDSVTCDWPGASRAQYTYYVHELPASFREGQLGNYIFARIERGQWQAVYIGQGDLGERISDSHHQADCIRGKATHVHVHLNASELNRLREERDLLAAHREAMAPIGCNLRSTG